MRQRDLELIAYEHDDDLVEIAPGVKFPRELCARFTYRRHVVEFCVRAAPGEPLGCTCVTITPRPESGGPAVVTREDLRDISLTALLQRALDDKAINEAGTDVADLARPRRRDITGELLERVARLYRDAGSQPAAVEALMEELHRSRAQAYRLINKAREAGYIPDDTQGGS